MIKQSILDNIEKYHQEQLLKYYEELDDEAKSSYERQLEELDFSYIDIFNNRNNNEESADSVYEPLQAMKIEEIESRKDEFRQAGIDALKQKKVGAVLLAGGQGTRLGFDKPKGMFNIGETKELYIFERLIQNIMDVVNETGVVVPLFIMTSEINDKDTRAFFEEKNYFGYDKDYIRAGLVDKMKEIGVEWLNVFAVDNVLQRIATPEFVGATLLSGYPSSAKVVKKADPHERVGVMCKKNGKPSIVEYYELTEEMANEKDASGEPAYNYGVILNYMFRVKELMDIAGNSMITHIVEKKIPHIDENGELVKPEEPNGYKFETLILDMIHMVDDCLVYEVERSKEFAPVKNKEGVDSVVSARELLKLNGYEI